MEPSSILTIIVTSVSVIVKTSLALKELSQKYHSADQEISFIIIRLNTIEAIVSQIGSWLRSEETLQQQIAKDIQMAVSACDFVVGEIYNNVEYVQDGWFSGRIRQLWNEEQQLYQRNLDSQISALGVLLNVAVLKSQCQQRQLLQDPRSRRSTLHDEFVEGGATSLSPDFRAELLHSRVYKAAMRKINSNSEQRALAGRSSLLTVDGADAVAPSTDAVFRSSSSSSTIAIASEKKSSSRRLGRRNDNRATLSEQLRDAVINGQPSTADQLCSSGADANYRPHASAAGAKTGVRSTLRRAIHHAHSHHDEPTLLHHAASTGNLPIIRTLVSHGAVLDARDKQDRTPLHLAATDAAAELLISLGANASAADRTRSRPLHHAASRNHTTAVSALLRAGANANAFNAAQQTPLHLACISGARKAVSLLVEAGAFVDASDADGLRPLHLAAQRGHDRIVRGLLRAGADAEAACRRRGWRAVHYGAGGGSVGVVEALLGVPVAVDVSASGAGTPLHVAARAGRREVVEALLRAGVAGVGVVDEAARGETPLLAAVGGGHAGVVDVLLRCEKEEAAGGVNAVNGAGRTPLGVACSSRSVDSALILVQMLVSSGARVRYEDYVSLWRNSGIPAREKKAIHAELDAVAPEELKKDEVEWLMTTL